MRIFLLVDCYLPNPISCAKLISDLAQEMTGVGHEVTVVTSDHTLPAAMEISEENHVTVLKVKTGKLKHESRAIRAINEIRLPRIIWNVARKFFEAHPCDLIVYYSPTIFWTYLVRKLKALHGCSTYLVLRDLFPQWALDAGLLSEYGPAYRYFRRQELKLYRTADVIGVQSPSDLDYFARNGLDAQHKLEVLFNWAKIDEVPAGFFGIRNKLGLKNEIIFVYGGRLGVAQNIDNIVRLAQGLRAEKNIFFLLLGDGSESERIKSTILQDSMTNIAVHSSVPQTEYLKILAECDVGVISLSRDLKTQNMTGKMLSYMTSGKPILASVNSGNNLCAMIPAYDVGLVSVNGETAIFQTQALRLARSSEERDRMGKNASKLLKEKFNVLAAARQITDHFDRLPARARSAHAK